MDDGSQKLLDVIDDPSALESFLGLSAAAAGESSSRTTLESLVDSLQQGLLDPSTTAGGGGTSARHASTGNPQTAPAGSLLLTQHQLQQLQQFQAGNATGRPQGQAVTFTLPPHSNAGPVVSSSASVVTSSSCIPVSTHHFVLTPFHHTGGGTTPQSHHPPHPITLINSPGQQGSGTLVSASASQPSTSFIYTPASSASSSLSTSGGISTTGLQIGNPNIAIGHGGTILATSAAGLHVGGTVPSTGMPMIGSTVGNTSMQALASNSAAGGSIFGASILPAPNSSTGGGVLVGPSGTTVFTPALTTNAISSPGSPFSVPTRSPAPHAPPTPSPSPLPLRSPASVPSHHPPSPAPSPYHSQLQSPQQQQQQQGSAANTPYILSASSTHPTPTNLLKEHYGNLQPHGVSNSQTPTSFVLSTASTNFKNVYNMQQPSSQPSVVVLPQQRSTMSGSNTNTSPSPAQSPYSNLQSPVAQQNTAMLNHHLVQHLGNNSVAPTRSPAPGGTQTGGTMTPGGALTPAPSPSPQTRTAASPVIRSTTPQPAVIHQTLPTGLALPGAGQFPVMPPGSTAMLQGNHQLVQIIHHQTSAPQSSAFPGHTQIITTGPGGSVPLQQSGTTAGGPKPKQPPQILPKPPSGQSTSGSHAKISANSRSNANTQHQGLHTSHHTTASAAQVVIGQANPSAVIPTAQAGTLLLNQVIPGLGAGGPVLVQPNPSGGVQLILRSPTSGTQTTVPPQSCQQNQQGKSPTPHQQPMFISGAATAQLLQSTGRQQMQQVLRLFTSQGPMQLQQIQTPSGPTLIAVPSGQTLSFQHLGPQAPPQHTQIPPQPPQGPRSCAAQHQPSTSPQQSATSIIPAVQLHQSNIRPSLNVGVPTSGTGCTPQHNVSVIGGHTMSLSTTNNVTPSIIHQNHHQVQPPVGAMVPQSQQDATPSQQNATYPIMRHNTPVLQTQHHQCTGTNTDQTSILALSPKKKPKKKKKKKKDEEPKLDLANIMKLSGIGDDEDLALYDTEEPQISAASQSPAPLEMNTQHSPVSQPQSAQQQSQLITQLRSPPQIPLQNATGGTASLRLAVEDGHVVLHHTPTDSQQSAANILLQNLPSAVGQQHHSVATAQNQLSALLASGNCGSTPTTTSGASNHVVLSQLLQTSPSGLPPHLISTSTNTSTTRSTNSASPSPQLSTSTNILHPQSQERFTVLQQQGGKSGFLKDGFSSPEMTNSSISQLTTSIAGKVDSILTNSTPGTFSIQAKCPGTMGCSSFRDGFVQPGSNKVDSSINTCQKASPTPSPSLILSSHDNATNLLLAKSPHQHTCHQEVTLKPPQDMQKHSSATTQTELIHSSIHLGPKQHDPVPFISAPKAGSDAGTTFLGLHPFSNIHGLVSTTAGSIPLVTAPVMTSGGGSFGGEQLLIAHHGGMSVLAAPQLIQCLQQAQNTATPGIINMPQLHLAHSAISKAIGQGLAFNTPTGTILIGGSPESFSTAVNNQHKPSIMTATNNTTTKLLPQQSSVLLQHLNTGTASTVRRCSSDSSNSNISIGSPPPIGGGSTGGTTAVIGLINQPVVNQSTSATSASSGARKNQQSIETQTISLGIPSTTSLQTAFLDSIVHTHPNFVKLVQSSTTAVLSGKKKKQKQPRTSKILPVVSSSNIIVNRECNSTGTSTDPVKSPLQERNFGKPNTVCQGTQHITRTTGNDASYVTASPFTLMQQSVQVSAVSCNTSNTNSIPPLTSICPVVQNTPTNILCQVGSTATSTATTMATHQSVMSKVAANLSVQTGTADVSTSSGHLHLPPSTSKPGMQHHCVASQTVSMQQPQSGMVPHLVPIPPGGSTISGGMTQATSVGMQSIIQKVQTIQLTPQNQKRLKAVQIQIQSVTSKRILTAVDQAALHRLYDEQQHILLTGKIVPTIPGQHALGVPLNPDAIPSTVDGKLKSQVEVEISTANTHLTNLLRQQLAVPHQSTQMPVRYQHQVGNQIIPLTPANLQQKPVPSSSVATTTTTASTVTTRASISVQCGTHLSPSDSLVQQPAGLATQTLPKLSVVQPMLQTTGMPTTPVSSTQHSKSTGQPSSCEKGTSPLQVQVGTQTALPCIESSSSCSPHLSVATSACSGKLSPGVTPSVSASSTNKLSPMSGQQLFSPGKVQPIFVASTASTKVQQSFSPSGSSKPSSQPAVLGCKVLASGGKPQAVVAPVSPSGSTSSRSSPAMATVPSGTSATIVMGGMTVVGSGKRPAVATSPIRSIFSRSDLIEQQLKTDQGGACMPDTCTPFQSTSDACKRLIRYHVFNEQLLSQQDLEKADEFFEATAKHLLDKFRQMMNKYRYLLLMESMREVNTSELMMIDRMFVAEEHGLLERLKEEERRAKEELVVPAEQQPSSPSPAEVLSTVKTEPGLPTPGGTTGDGLREVRVLVRDVMKNESIKRELEEERKFTIVKRERLDSPASNKDLHQAYDEWEEIQKELAVYCGPNNISAAASTGNSTLTHAVKVEEQETPLQPTDHLHLSTVGGIKTECVSVALDLKHAEAEGKVQPQSDNVDAVHKLPPAGSLGTKARSGACGPRDEGGGLEEEVNRTLCGKDGVGEKRKEFCDTSVDGMTSVGHRKKRHKHGYSPQQNECADDEDDDINAQVQCAINSILNLQRSEDGFDIRPSATTPSSEMGVDEGLDCEDTRQYPHAERTESAASSSKPCSGSANEMVRARHKRNSATCKTVDQQVVNHHEDSGVGNTDSALDEAVRSILTS
ncbi:mucin-12-like isoform X2 [Zootermopsis nevadensis]|uniref:mucin-12-like isoform X2 n=1 Tax=Zootermopsis nevadensis TaxID=136037 RepID=UPI000B8E9236|nr:mucin-12-like isoform X2 [Zootermopsis nevadensis]